MRYRERVSSVDLNTLIDRVQDNQPCPCAYCWRAAVRREADRMRLHMSEEAVNLLAGAMAADAKLTKRWWCGR